MSQQMFRRRVNATPGTTALRAVGLLAGVALALAVMPQAASAQFGALKRLKNAVSPDSAAKVAAATQDSIALAAKLAAGDTTPLQRSRLSRAVSAAGAASEKFEQATGVSVKDAALVATGVGASAVIAKKMGTDPVSLGAKALDKVMDRPAQPDAGAAAGMAGMPSIPGMPDMAELMRMQQAASAQLPTAALPGSRNQVRTGNAVLGFTEADALAMAGVQQEMMQVAMAASAGDAAAQARLERWQTIALRYQPEMEKLSIAASGGDMTAMQRLQQIQVDILKEWANTASAKPLKASKPVRASKP